MSIEMFCPQWYYIGTVSDEKQTSIKDLFAEFLSIEDNFTQPDDWKCTVKSSYNNPRNSAAPWTEFVALISDQISEFMNDMSPITNVSLIPQEAWVNKYPKGGFQEYHDHSVHNCNLSMVYFFTEFDDTVFRFYNNEDSKYKSSGLKQVFTIPSANAIIPKAHQGDVMIFPSFYPHYVCPNGNDEERITFSANFLVTPQEPAQGSPQTP